MTQRHRPSAPPYNEKAEQDVLGAVMLSLEAWDEVGPTLTGPDFFVPQHRLIWGAIEEAIKELGAADATTTLEILRSRKQLGDVDGSYLISLTNGVASPRNAPQYGRIVRELSLRRRLMGGAAKVAADAQDGEDYRDAVEALVREVYRADAPGVTTARTAAEILASPPQATEMLTDPPLLVRQGISVLASDTKVGKTNLMLHLSWALTEGKPLFGLLNVPSAIPVLLIELELTEATVYRRLDILRETLGWDEGLSRFNVWCGRALQIDDRNGANRLAQIIQTTVPKPELVIIDSYNAAIGGDPDSTKESRRGLNSLRSLQERFGVAFGIVCELRKPPPGQNLRYAIHDLKGNNVVAYDADAVVMLRPCDPKDPARRKLSLQFPALRHCEDLPDNLVLHRKGLTFDLERTVEDDSDIEHQMVAALRDHQEGGGSMSWRECAKALRSQGMKFENDMLTSVRQSVLGMMPGITA